MECKQCGIAWSSELLKEGLCFDCTAQRLKIASDTYERLRQSYNADVLRLREERDAAMSNRDRFCKHINLIGDRVLGARDCHAPDAVSRETINLINNLRALKMSATQDYNALHAQVKDLADTVDAGIGVNSDKSPIERLSSQLTALLQCYIAERIANMTPLERANPELFTKLTTLRSHQDAAEIRNRTPNYKHEP